VDVNDNDSKSWCIIPNAGRVGDLCALCKVGTTTVQPALCRSSVGGCTRHAAVCAKKARQVAGYPFVALFATGGRFLAPRILRLTPAQSSDLLDLTT
jgi:hypothetical protein